MSRKNLSAALIMVVIGLGIFWYEMRTVNLAQLKSVVTHMQPGWLLVAVVVTITSWLIEAVVIRVFVEHSGERLPAMTAIRVPLVEQLFNNITPFASGGQPAQLIALMQSGVEAGRASSVLLMKFVVYQFMILVSFVLTIAIGFEQVRSRFGALAWLIVFGFLIHVVVIVGLLLVMYRYRFTKRLVTLITKLLGLVVGSAKQQRWQSQMDHKIDSFYAESLHLKREKTKVLKAAGLTFIQLLVFFSVPYFVLLSLRVPQVNFVEVLILHVMIVMIVSLFPVPGGTGGAEYSFKTLFATFMITKPQLVVALLLWRFLTYYLGMLLGAVALAIPAQALRVKKSKKLG